ncbi:MAG: S41 family peptidase [Myxococcota bacterium]
MIDSTHARWPLVAAMLLGFAAWAGGPPTCEEAASVLEAAIARHVSVNEFGPEHALRAGQAALELFREDLGPYLTPADLAAARRILQRGSAARRAAHWASGGCDEFIQLAGLRAQAIRRMEALLEESLSAALGGRVLPPQTALEREVRTAVLRFLQRQETFAPRELAVRYTRRVLARQMEELRERNRDWAAVTMARVTVGALDRHSRFLLSREKTQLDEELGDGLGLFGVSFAANGMTPWGYLLAKPPAGTPGALPGNLEAGLVLAAIDGESTVGKRQAELCDWLGAAGPRVELEVARIENRALVDRRTVVLERGDVVDEVHRIPVREEVLDGVRVATVTLPGFFSGAGDLLGKELERLSEDGVHVVVLDLRGNSGGYLTEALRVLDVLCPDESFVDLQSAGEVVRRAGPGLAQAWSGPLVVAVDGETASAAEIVAGTLQAKGRALVVGATTWGKGTTQSGLDVGVPWGEALVTESHFFLVNGRSPQCTGIVPDVALPEAKVVKERECSTADALPEPPPLREWTSPAEVVRPWLQRKVDAAHGLAAAAVSYSAQLDDLRELVAEW